MPNQRNQSYKSQPSRGNKNSKQQLPTAPRAHRALQSQHKLVLRNFYDSTSTLKSILDTFIPIILGTANITMSTIQSLTVGTDLSHPDNLMMHTTLRMNHLLAELLAASHKINDFTVNVRLQAILDENLHIPLTHDTKEMRMNLAETVANDIHRLELVKRDIDAAIEKNKELIRTWHRDTLAELPGSNGWGN